MKPTYMKNNSSFCDEEPESYETYSKRTLESAENKLFESLSKITNSSLRKDDKERFKQRAAKLLMAI